MPGPFRTRAEAIAHAKRRTPRYRVPFPDLSVEQRTPPCSNAITAIAPRPTPASAHRDASSFPVGHSHKQALQLITPGAIASGELQWLGGRKS